MDIRDIVELVPVIPVITLSDAGQAVPLARALVKGGLRVMEVTMQTPLASAYIEAIRREVPEAVVGAGTLTRPADFASAGRAGAQFGVTPGLTSELISASRGARFPLLPGAMTPSEVIAARNAGFGVLRLLPAHHIGGVQMLQTLGTLFPDILFCPSGGVTRASAPDYLALPNVLSVGCSWVAPGGLLAAQHLPGIEALARGAAALRRPASAAG